MKRFDVCTSFLKNKLFFSQKGFLSPSFNGLHSYLVCFGIFDEIGLDCSFDRRN